MTISVSLPQTEIDFLKKNLVKSYGFTLNKLIKYFADNSLQIITAGRVFDTVSEVVYFGISAENLRFVDAAKIASKSYTVACLVATARELDLKI